MEPFSNLEENISALEDAGHLRRIEEPVNKDTELMPLVRCQFRGLPESERTAWLFENVTDANGSSYDIPLGVALLGPSRDVYRFNLGVEDDAGIVDKWNTALEQPIEPKRVEDAPCKAVVKTGSEIETRGNGIDAFPTPISTPGYDPAPFFSSAFVVTKDPETGITNVGTYRCHLKSPSKFGIYFGSTQDIHTHWEKARANDEPLEVAVLIGAPPQVSMVSASKVPYDVDELAVSGGLMGQPLSVVDCETVDLSVPAVAEIVIEGEITPEVYDEGPFGEFTGYMGDDTCSPNVEVSAITHRENPIAQAFISQMPPSESSTIRKVGYEENVLQHLRRTTLTGVSDVVLHEASGSQNFLVVQLDKQSAEEPWQALYAAMGYHSDFGKVAIAVDEDIDPHDLESVVWALAFRMQPHRDVEIVPHRRSPLDPSSLAEPLRRDSNRESRPSVDQGVLNVGDSSLLIDATMPWDFPPTSLPKREFMEAAIERWDELGLPDLDLVSPWYGTSLGDWSAEKANMAADATEGRYFDE